MNEKREREREREKSIYSHTYIHNKAPTHCVFFWFNFIRCVQHISTSPLRSHPDRLCNLLASSHGQYHLRQDLKISVKEESLRPQSMTMMQVFYCHHSLLVHTWLCILFSCCKKRFATYAHYMTHLSITHVQSPTSPKHILFMTFASYSWQYAYHSRHYAKPPKRIILSDSQIFIYDSWIIVYDSYSMNLSRLGQPPFFTREGERTRERERERERAPHRKHKRVPSPSQSTYECLTSNVRSRISLAESCWRQASPRNFTALSVPCVDFLCAVTQNWSAP